MRQNATLLQHQKLAYSIRELSKLAGVCERKIHYEIKEGKLKSSRIGRRVLIRAAEVERWLAAAETA